MFEKGELWGELGEARLFLKPKILHDLGEGEFLSIILDQNGFEI